MYLLLSSRTNSRSLKHTKTSPNVKAKTIASVLLAAFALAGCSEQADPDQGAKSQAETTPSPSPTTNEEQSNDEVHWGYSGENGPDNWGDLSPEFATCSTGEEQSPIDINEAISPGCCCPACQNAGNVPELTSATSPEAALAIGYNPASGEVINTGHSIQFNPEEEHTLRLNGVDYELLQFHFHTPSEHTIEGEPAAGEVHFVHQDPDGNLAVIGVLIEEGAAHEELEKILNHSSDQADSSEVVSSPINLDEFFPDSTTYVSYSGSLTTPG